MIARLQVLKPEPPKYEAAETTLSNDFRCRLNARPPLYLAQLSNNSRTTTMLTTPKPTVISCMRKHGHEARNVTEQIRMHKKIFCSINSPITIAHQTFSRKHFTRTKSMETHAVLFTTSELQSAFLHSNDISINT